MTKRGVSSLAVTAVAMTLLGTWSTACSLDTGETLMEPPDSSNSDPPVTNVVPVEVSESQGLLEEVR